MRILALLLCLTACPSKEETDAPPRSYPELAQECIDIANKLLAERDECRRNLFVAMSCDGRTPTHGTLYELKDDGTATATDIPDTDLWWASHTSGSLTK